MLQRLLEFLPFEQFFEEASHTVKVVSRAWRTAARRALTRGHWKSLRVLFDRGKLMCDGASDVAPEARRAFDRDAREAWALYPEEVTILSNSWGSLTTSKYLSLVVEPTKQGFRSIVAVFETVLQCSRGSRHAPWLMFLLWRWLDRALPDTFGGQNSTFERIATPE